jgi:uncharacterized membrane protein YeaQ/YmgE (transglycosylase-associated protein family)
MVTCTLNIRRNYELIRIFVLLLIAASAGAIGQLLSGYTFGGCLISIVIGYIGACIGLWIGRQFGLPVFLSITIDNESFPLIWSILGSGFLSAILGIVLRQHRLV